MMRDLSSLAVTPASTPVTSCLQGWLADLICPVVREQTDPVNLKHGIGD
jgi:hypothetical protein